MEVCGPLDGTVCFLGLRLVLVPIILVLISSGVLSILIQWLSLQWFHTMWEARSFVDVIKNLQEVQCSFAFFSWSLFLFLAGLHFGLLVVSAGVPVSMVFHASAALTTSVFFPVVQGVAVTVFLLRESSMP